MIENRSKRLLVVSLFLTLMMAFSLKAYASSPYMLGLGLNWDLVPDKTVTFQTSYPGVGLREARAIVQNFQHINQGNGYNQITMTISFTHSSDWSDAEIHTMAEILDGGSFGNTVWAIIDYETGKSLEHKNNAFDVKVTSSNSTRGTYEYYDEDDCWIRLNDRTSTIKIVYPSAYDGVCIGVGGRNHVWYEGDGDDLYFDGIGLFDDTDFYDVNNKRLTHFMRVRAADAKQIAKPSPQASVDKITISKKPAQSKPKAAAKGKVTFSWKKFKQTKKTKAVWKKVKKIEVQYSTDPSFKTGVTSKLVGKKKTKLVVKKLQKNTTYYVRIRYTDGAGGYSDWSATKKIKTKKK